MEKTTYVIFTTYGFSGFHNGIFREITTSALDEWCIYHAGSPLSIAKGFRDAMDNSNISNDTNHTLQKEGIPVEYARWLVFSVIQSWDSHTVPHSALRPNRTPPVTPVPPKSAYC